MRETACRVVVDGDEDESYLVCLTCDPGREVCCGHHLAPHYEDGCRELVAGRKCLCERRRRPAAEPAPPTDGLREEIARDLGGVAWEIALERHRDRLRTRADTILALPGIQRLIAAEDAGIEASLRLARIRALVNEHPADAVPVIGLGELRRALDGA